MKYKKRKLYLYEAVLLENTKESFEEAYRLVGDKVILAMATDGTFINYINDDFYQVHIGEYIIKGPNGFLGMSKEEFEKEFIEADEEDLYD